jgi:hypothetical protein
VIDPSHPDTLFVGNFDNGAVYRSVDRGLTWELRSFAGDRLCALAVRPDSANILYAGTGNGTITKSTDAGVTWRLVKDEGAFETPHISVDPFDPLTAYATAFSGHDSTTGVWKTTDGGEHWSQVGLPGVSTWGMDLDRINPDIVYAGEFASGLGVFRSTDGGVSWSSLSEGLMGTGAVWNLKVHPLDSDMLWIANGNGIYRWTQVLGSVQGMVRDAATGDPVTNGVVELLSTGERVVLDTSQGFFSLHYYEGDTSLTPVVHVEAFPYFIQNEGVEFIPDSVINRDIFLTRLPRTSLSGTVRDSISHFPLSADLTLFSTTTLGSMTYSSSTETDGRFVIDSLLVSQPPLVSYDAVAFEAAFPHSRFTVGPIYLDTLQNVLDVLIDTADVLLTSSSGSGDFSSYYAQELDNMGVTYHFWNPMEKGTPPLSRAQEMRKSILIYYTGNDTLPLPQYELDSLHRGLDLGVHTFITGQNFVEANASSALLSEILWVGHAQNTNVIVCLGQEGDLFSGFGLTTTGGTGANNQVSRDVIQVLDPLAVPTLVYGGGSTAAVRLDSVAGGARVLLFGFGFEAITFAQIRRAVMETIIGYLDGSIVVDVGSRPNAPLPESFRLEQNYPNPFNPNTTINYELPERAFVTLKVYNVLGQEVATLVSGEKEAGSYQVQFSGKDLATGVYLYRMSVVPGAPRDLVPTSRDGRVGELVATKKLLLLR